jgi:Ca-activated chloride channel family protein
VIVLEAIRGLLPLSGIEHPWMLVLLLGLGAAALVASLRRSPPALAWPALDEVHAAGGRRRDPLLTLSRALRIATLFTLALVVAGPLARDPRPPPQVEGLDVVLVVDTSLSMRALDAEVDGEWRTRLHLAREVVRRFALHRLVSGDRVGLVVFGETAFTQCPLTSDGHLLAAALERVVPGMAGEATALGDALALAVKRVTVDEGAEPTGAGRVVVILTDGRSNAGVIPTDVAIDLARAREIRVHTVGIGSEGEVAIAGSEGQAGRGLRFERHDLDVETLAEIADATGGRVFEARTPSDLEAVYQAIDALERVPRPEEGEERPGRPLPEPFLALAGGLLLGEVATARVLRRRLP